MAEGWNHKHRESPKPQHKFRDPEKKFILTDAATLVEEEIKAGGERLAGDLLKNIRPLLEEKMGKKLTTDEFRDWVRKNEDYLKEFLADQYESLLEDLE